MSFIFVTEMPHCSHCGAANGTEHYSACWTLRNKESQESLKTDSHKSFGLFPEPTQNCVSCATKEKEAIEYLLCKGRSDAERELCDYIAIALDRNGYRVVTHDLVEVSLTPTTVRYLARGSLRIVKKDDGHPFS